jgi:hypothetical protein
MCVAGGGYNTSHGSEPFFASELSGIWGASHEALLPATAVIKGQSAAVQAIACANTTRCVAAGYYFSKVDTADTTGVTFTGASSTWSRGLDVSLPHGATKASNQQSSGNGVACPNASSCTIIGTYLDGYSEGSFASIPATVPSAPHIQKVTPIAGGFSVTIKAPASNGGIPIATYQYSIDGGTSWKNRQSGTNSTTIVITKLTAHHKYRLAIRAVTQAGAGPKSNVVTATTK